MPGDRAYSDVRHRVGPAVSWYQKHTYIVQDFIKQHGLKVLGWETWDVAPFHVLNARKGEPVPKEILQALDAAISGREAVSDQFTVANVNPAVLMDASDVTHRVFVEKLRTLRRVWFPDVPEKNITTPQLERTSALTASLALMQTPKGAAEPTKIGSFSALAGESTGSDFYKVSFDKPMELTIATGALKRSFEVSAGHVKLTECLTPATLRTQNNANHDFAIPSLKQTAADVAAHVSARLRGDDRKARRNRFKLVNVPRPPTETPAMERKEAGFIKDPARTVPSAVHGRAVTRSMTTSARAQVVEREYIQIPDDAEDEVDDEASNDKVLSPDSAARKRRNSFGEDNRDLVDCADTTTTNAVPAFMASHTKWIVDVSPLGDITFFDPNGASPCTYLEEEEAKDKLRDLLSKRLPLEVVVKYQGQSYQLSEQAIEILSNDNAESVVEMIPQLIAVT